MAADSRRWPDGRGSGGQVCDDERGLALGGRRTVAHSDVVSQHSETCVTLLNVTPIHLMGTIGLTASEADKMCQNENSQRMLKEGNMRQLLCGGPSVSTLGTWNLYNFINRCHPQ